MTIPWCTCAGEDVLAVVCQSAQEMIFLGDFIDVLIHSHPSTKFSVLFVVLAVFVSGQMLLYLMPGHP